MRVPSVAFMVENCTLEPQHVLVQRFRVGEKTAGGLVRPDVARDREQRNSGYGVVLLAGERSFWGRGQVVWFHPFGGYACTAEDALEDELLILKDAEILMAAKAEAVERLLVPEAPEEAVGPSLILTGGGA